MSVKTPNLCHLAPAGPTYMEDLNEAGGVYAVMNELAKKDLLNLDCLTVTGKTVGENIARTASTGIRRSSGQSTTRTARPAALPY